MGIAIIGAGFSGLLAAYLLKKKGIPVTVYEKDLMVGGHCHTLKTGEGYLELGTAFSFNASIKELLRELDIPYSERLTYRSFIDGSYKKAEQLEGDEVASLIKELGELSHILKPYEPELMSTSYGWVHPDLLVSLDTFLETHGLHTISKVIAPHLSSYGFGSVKETQAYYAFNIFDLKTIQAFVKGEKLLFVDQGMSVIVERLAQQLDDIRLNAHVTQVSPLARGVSVLTEHTEDAYDQVLITCPLSSDVVEDPKLAHYMARMKTHSYVSCAFNVSGKQLVTTYYKENMGRENKIQFYHTHKTKQSTNVVTYAYGKLHKGMLRGIVEELELTGMKVNHLIMARQWQIFPHFAKEDLASGDYLALKDHQLSSPIKYIGTLVSKPSIANLYEAVKEQVEML